MQDMQDHNDIYVPEGQTFEEALGEYAYNNVSTPVYEAGGIALEACGYYEGAESGDDEDDMPDFEHMTE